MKKICSHPDCKKEKDIKEFNERILSSGKRIPNSVCKSCLAKKQREYRKTKKNIQYNKQYYKNNADKRKQYTREYVSNNQDRVNDWKRNNEERIINYRKDYYKNNKQHLSRLNMDNHKKRYNNDPLYKLKHILRTNIKRSFKLNGFYKKNKTQEILGCSFIEFKQHLESQFEDWMNWDNYGLYDGNYKTGWDIDHIIPVSCATNEKDLYNLNHYTNLQPLCSKINRDEKKNNILDVATH